MTKLPKIERCVCGAEATFAYVTKRVRCSLANCWMGECCNTKKEQILTWNTVMKAAKAAKKAKVRK